LDSRAGMTRMWLLLRRGGRRAVTAQCHQESSPGAAAPARGPPGRALPRRRRRPPRAARLTHDLECGTTRAGTAHAGVPVRRRAAGGPARASESGTAAGHRATASHAGAARGSRSPALAVPLAGGLGPGRSRARGVHWGCHGGPRAAGPGGRGRRRGRDGRRSGRVQVVPGGPCPGPDGPAGLAWCMAPGPGPALRLSR
jgi:hypothetical protein